MISRLISIVSSLARLCLFSCLISIFSISNSIAECVDYSDYVRWVGRTGYLDSAQDIEFEGNYVYVASGEDGFKILNGLILNYQPIIGAADTEDFATAVAINQNFAYVTDRWSGLQIIDIANPQNPTVVGNLDTPGHAKDVCIQDNFAYVADGWRGLQIIDVATPDSPELVANINATGSASSVTIDGNFAYVAAEKLWVVDISNPSSPELLKIFDTPDYVKEITIKGSYAYIADYRSGLLILDISTPSNPLIVSELVLPGFARDITLQGPYAFISGLNRFHVVDITEPAYPLFITTYGTQHPVRDIIAHGGYLYAMSHQLLVADIQSPEIMLETVDVELSAPGVAIAVGSDYAYVGQDNGYLEVVDISAKVPYSVGLNQFGPGDFMDFVLHGDHIFATRGELGLAVINISDPANPTQVAELDTPGFAKGLAVRGNYTYIADDNTGLLILDTQTPETPLLISTLDLLPFRAQKVVLSGDYAYVAAGYLTTINISDPFAPFIETYRDLQAQHLCVEGDNLYLRFTDEGIVRFDISSPTDLDVVNGFRFSGSSGPFFVKEGFAYFCRAELGVGVEDVITPQHSTYWQVNNPLEGPALNLALANGFVYITTPDNLLRITPQQCDAPVAVFLSMFDVQVSDGAVRVHWHITHESEPSRFRLVASNDQSEWVVPHVEGERGYFLAEDSSTNLDTHGEVYYRLFYNEGNGLWTMIEESSVQLDLPKLQTGLNAIYPNPFNPQTTINFDTSQAGPVCLNIYNLQGRLVTTLINESMPAGRHDSIWLGRDSSDREVAAGQYLVRLVAGDQIDIQKITLCK